jgi:hypothetical protein
MSDDNDPTFTPASGYSRPRRRESVNPALIIVFVLGCVAGFGALGWILFRDGKNEASKPTAAAKLEPPAPAAGGEKGKSKDTGDGAGMTYALKYRAKRKGDKYAITETIVNVEGKGELAKRDQETYECVEEIHETDPVTNTKTKFTHVYKVARKIQDGRTTDLPYAGKTVQFDCIRHPRILVDGQVTLEKEVPELTPLLDPPGFGYMDILPTRPVKLNEQWTDPTAVKRFMKDKPALTANFDRSEFSGKLTRVYTKDGVQWGVIEASMFVVCEGRVVGTMNRKWKWETIIDGVHRNENLTIWGTSDLMFAGSRITTDNTNKMTVQLLK